MHSAIKHHKYGHFIAALIIKYVAVNTIENAVVERRIIIKYLMK